MRLFVENIKGYMENYDNVYKVNIKKVNNKNHLVIYYNSYKAADTILLKNVKLAYLIDVESMHEYFRYVKSSK